MKQLIYSLQSEWIKTKNSAITWLTVAGALFIPAIILLSRLMQHTNTAMMNATQGIWIKLFDKNWQFMSTFLLPMGIILASSIITQIEYRNNTWKQLYTTPQKLSTIFWSKYIIVFLVLLQFFLLFNIGIFLTGALPAILLSDVPYPAEPFPFKAFLSGNGLYLIYCLPIIALQYLLSLHIKNFIISIGIGLALLIASLIGMSYEYGYIIPYIYGPMKFLNVNGVANLTVNTTYWALGYFIFFSIANYLLFISKTQTTASKYFTVKNLIILLSLLLIASIYIGLARSSNSNSNTSLSDSSPEQIQKNILEVEQNLGVFHTGGNTDWSILDRMKYYKVHGLSIAVIKNYKIEWAKGYGYADVEGEIPVIENTVFEPGSISKSLNAFALMKLVQDKSIDLFSDINNYLISWKFPYDEKSKGKTITLANLLSHTAGLNVHGYEGYKPGDSLPTIPQILDGKYPANSSPVRSVSEPSTEMEYSGGGTMISQMMLMDMTQQAYDQYLASNVFEPLAMSNSFFTQPLPTQKIATAAIGYDTLGNAIPGKYPVMAEQAAGGLWTTATDLCKFVIEMQLSLKSKSNRVLDQKNTTLMLTPYIDENTTLGFSMIDGQGHKYFSHDAANRGFSGTFCGSMENGNGVAILINSENSGIINEIRNAIIDVYQWQGFNKKQRKKIIAIDHNITDKYIGSYESKTDPRKVEITKENGQLYYTLDHQKRKMYFTSDIEFVNMENPSTKTFTISTNNSVEGFKSSYNDKEISFNKVK